MFVYWYTNIRIAFKAQADKYNYTKNSDASYCQESIAFFHIFIFQTTEVPAVSTLDHGGLKCIQPASVESGQANWYSFVTLDHDGLKFSRHEGFSVVVLCFLFICTCIHMLFVCYRGITQPSQGRMKIRKKHLYQDALLCQLHPFEHSSSFCSTFCSLSKAINSCRCKDARVIE